MSKKEKYYEDLLMEVINMQEDAIRTSTEKDPFNDDWTDGNMSNAS